MKPSEAVLFVDLDGTLFHDDGYVSKENRDAIKDFIDQGGLFAISSGRTPPNALQYLDGVPINAPSIVINGSAVYDFKKKEYSECVYLDRSYCDPLLKRTLDEYPDVDVEVYTHAGINYCVDKEKVQPDLFAIHQPCTFIPLEKLEAEPFFKAIVVPPPPCLDELKELWQSHAEGHYTILDCTTTIGNIVRLFDIVPYGINKGVTLNKIRSYPELKGRTILAMGDYWNDYELLKEADIAISPANAIPELKRISDYITVSNNDHAVSVALRELLPIITPRQISSAL